MLLAECDRGQVTRWQPCRLVSVAKMAADPYSDCMDSYEVQSDRGTVRSRAVVVATGGLSIPKIGATDLGYRIARQFGLNVIEPRPALVPLTFDSEAWQPYAALSGLSLPVQIEVGSKKTKTIFHEDLLFTHRGLSGPAVLQISSFWQAGTPIRLDLAAGIDLAGHLTQAKASSRRRVANELAALVPARLADTWIAGNAAWQRPINEATDKALAQLADALTRWELTPTGTEGYAKAEVTVGGISTAELSSRTMEARKLPGLYVIGEAVDVTGWLGGYNFQWAWASGVAAGEVA